VPEPRRLARSEQVSGARIRSRSGHGEGAGKARGGAGSGKACWVPADAAEMAQKAGRFGSIFGGAESGRFEDKIAQKNAKKRNKSQKIGTDFWPFMLILKVVMTKNGVSECAK
jgi:hypothetical protein